MGKKSAWQSRVKGKKKKKKTWKKDRRGLRERSLLIATYQEGKKLKSRPVLSSMGCSSTVEEGIVIDNGFINGP